MVGINLFNEPILPLNVCFLLKICRNFCWDFSKYILWFFLFNKIKTTVCIDLENLTSVEQTYRLLT